MKLLAYGIIAGSCSLGPLSMGYFDGKPFYYYQAGPVGFGTIGQEPIDVFRNDQPVIRNFSITGYDDEEEDE
ncbi:hypothetical protein [Methylacidimicrobium sp. B4]|uniref:hypothetical protein n=1 Tax=Methylacidimicrobium sp. B4 TaxID=2796139 RepID=UPI001A8E66C6|nr:hypothetical protein [Methylacidimicrobium sp. B4]QSR85598.1 hypothetical protein MacB4_05095 [Methylacidimicrobium sp. B4]